MGEAVQLISTILKIAPGIILWIQKGWLAGILGLIAALALTWAFTIMTLSSDSPDAMEAGKYWIGPAVSVIVLGLAFLFFRIRI